MGEIKSSIMLLKSDETSVSAGGNLGGFSGGALGREDGVANGEPKEEVVEDAIGGNPC
jgi:hypothetical protein